MLRSVGHVFKQGKPDAPALITPQGATFYYAECQALVTEIQNRLKSELDSPVTVMYPNCVDFVLLFVALTELVPVNPLNPNYKEEDIKFYMKDSGSKCLILPRESLKDHPGVKVAEQLQAGVVYTFDIDEFTKQISLEKVFSFKKANNRSFKSDGVALILHTSGTTSKPKGVPLTHTNICKTINNVIKTYNLTSTDRSLVVMPLFHVHGLIGALLSTLASGGSAVITSFSATSFWRLFEKFDCTWYSAVPTIHQILLKHEMDVGVHRKKGKLRFIRSCSSSLPPAVFEMLESTYGVPVLEAYAMTEAAHQMASNPLPPSKRKPGSVGIPQGVQVKIIDGEVCIKGDNVMKGYINRPEANKESFIDGWFRTGDQGKLDSEGYLYLTGRLKEMINRGGEKIAPLEIDHVLSEVNGVAEAVAFGVPSEMYGEEVYAAVVLRNDSKLQESDLKEACKRKLVKFKVPTKIFIVKEIPKTPTGKVQRRFVAAHFSPNKSKL